MGSYHLALVLLVHLAFFLVFPNAVESWIALVEGLPTRLTVLVSNLPINHVAYKPTLYGADTIFG